MALLRSMLVSVVLLAFFNKEACSTADVSIEISPSEIIAGIMNEITISCNALGCVDNCEKPLLQLDLIKDNESRPMVTIKGGVSFVDVYRSFKANGIIDKDKGKNGFLSVTLWKKLKPRLHVYTCSGTYGDYAKGIITQTASANLFVGTLNLGYLEKFLYGMRQDIEMLKLKNKNESSLLEEQTNRLDGINDELNFGFHILKNNVTDCEDSIDELKKEVAELAKKISNS